jgi:hypothetical protein
MATLTSIDTPEEALQRFYDELREHNVVPA